MLWHGKSVLFRSGATGPIDLITAVIGGPQDEVRRDAQGGNDTRIFICVSNITQWDRVIGSLARTGPQKV